MNNRNILDLVGIYLIQMLKIATILKNETFKLSSHLLLKGNNNRSTILKGERMNYVQLELRKTTLAV